MILTEPVRSETQEASGRGGKNQVLGMLKEGLLKFLGEQVCEGRVQEDLARSHPPPRSLFGCSLLEQHPN